MKHLNLDAALPKGQKEITIFGVTYDVSAVPGYCELKYYDIVQRSQDLTEEAQKLLDQSKKLAAEGQEEEAQKLALKTAEQRKIGEKLNEELYSLAAEVFQLNGHTDITAEKLQKLDKQLFARMIGYLIFGTGADLPEDVVKKTLKNATSK